MEQDAAKQQAIKLETDLYFIAALRSERRSE